MPVIPDGYNIFVVDIEYVVPLEQVEPWLDDHIAFLKDHYESGLFLASGAKVPRSGGVILAISDARERVEAVIKGDPFFVQGVARFTVTEFLATRTADSLR